MRSDTSNMRGLCGAAFLVGSGLVAVRDPAASGMTDKMGRDASDVRSPVQCCPASGSLQSCPLWLCWLLAGLAGGRNRFMPWLCRGGGCTGVLLKSSNAAGCTTTGNAPPAAMTDIKPSFVPHCMFCRTEARSKRQEKPDSR